MKLKSMTWEKSTRTRWVLTCAFQGKGRRGITVASVRCVRTRAHVEARTRTDAYSETYYAELLGNPFWFQSGFDDLEAAMTAAVREAQKVITQLASRMLKP